MGLAFEAIPSRIPEIHQDQLTATEICKVNAYRKARSVARKVPDRLVLGADTLVYTPERIFSKPATLEEAYEMLESLQGGAHQVVTAVCLMCLRDHAQRIFSEHTVVRFRSLDSVRIRRYLSRVNPLDKAGAYAIQEEGDLIVEGIEGSYDNVVGLPTERLKAELTSWRREAGSWQTGYWTRVPLPNPEIAPSNFPHPR